MEILLNLFNLIIRFLNQNSNKFSRICCSKHLILNSTTLISIFLLMLFFNSEILSNIVYNPLLHIDSLDDLAKFISTNPDVSLISDNSTRNWELMHTSQDDQIQMIFRKMQSLSYLEFDFEQVYRGKSILIFFDDFLIRIINRYPSLKFHISNDRHFGSQYGFIYSKYLNKNIQIIIDSKIRSVVETGLNDYWKSKQFSSKLNISDFDETHHSLSMDDFKNILMLFLYIFIFVMITFLIEYVITRLNLVAEIKLRRPRVEVNSKTVPSPPVEDTQLNVVSITWVTCSAPVLRVPKSVVTIRHTSQADRQGGFNLHAVSEMCIQVQWAIQRASQVGRKSTKTYIRGINSDGFTS